jgi:hypothetical protein
MTRIVQYDMGEDDGKFNSYSTYDIGAFCGYIYKYIYIYNL